MSDFTPITIPMTVSTSGDTLPMSVQPSEASETVPVGSQVAYTGPQGPQGDPGQDGFSPVVEITEGEGQRTISITDASGTQSTVVLDGQPGRDGSDGRDGRDGSDGSPGQDGYSPTASVSKSDGVATITITDKSGTTTTTISDGQDGAAGRDGSDGADGFSPSASVTKSGKVTTISITDKNGTTTQTVSDGENGAPGADGFSPSASVSKDGSTATISITDKSGTTTATVSDGSNGAAGADGKSAYSYAVDGGYTGTEQQFAAKLAQEIPTKTSDLTNDAGFISGMYIASYGHSTWAEILAAYTAGKIVYCRASSNQNPGTGNQGRMAFMAYVNLTNNTPTSIEFQYYRSVSSHSDSQQGDQVYVYTINNKGTWAVTVREAYTKIVAGTGLTSSYSNGVLTISLA